MVVRKVETFPLIIMGHIRGHGCRDLLVYYFGAMPSPHDYEQPLAR
jgi:hypothetical protein